MPARASLSFRAVLLALTASPLLPAQVPSPRRPFPMSLVDESPHHVRFAADRQALLDLRQRQDLLVEAMPMPGSPPADLWLRRIEVFDEHSILAVDGVERPARAALPDLSMWTGRVVGETDSFVFLSFSPGGSRGVIRRHDGSLLRMTPDPVGGTARLDRIDTQDAPPVQAGCMTALIEQPLATPPLAGNPSHSSTPETIFDCKVAVETDYKFYKLFDDVDAATLYATELMGAVSALYLAEVNCIVTLPYLGIHSSSNDGWTSPDNGGDAGDVLTEFRDAWKNGAAPVSANLYHFLSGADLGGGVAYLDALCSQSFGFGVSGNIEGFLTFPPAKGFDTWDFVVTSHELGHNFGASHTHDYCPSLDDCAPAGYFGACQSSQVCISNGTVMSYCHLCSGGMTNIDLRFHPTVATDIRTVIEASCLEEAVITGTLCLVSDAEVSVTCSYANGDPDGATVSFDNCGIADSLAWSAILLDDVSWVSLSSATGTITTLGADLDLTFHTTGLGSGTYATTLRITNDADVLDVLDVPITLEVTPARIQVGDVLRGTIVDVEDIDRCVFDGLKGATLSLLVAIGGDGPAISITVLDPNGDKLAKWNVSGGESVQKKVKLDASGDHSIKVTSQDGSVGDYELGTDIELPGSAGEKSHKVSPKKGDNFADVKFFALAGASLDATVTPNAKVVDPLSLLLFDPNDASIDLSANLTIDGLSGVPLAVTGKYRLRISGFTGAKKEAATVDLVPTQPSGGSDVTID